jgi:hypothetical protein
LRVRIFGDPLATLPEDTVAALNRSWLRRGRHYRFLSKIDASVHIAGKPFEGLEVVATQVLSGKERIRVLLDFRAIARDGNPNSKKFSRLSGTR